tara:strand:- start:418 stop:1083 length:666 start_codon:yes stop_codon:yes gene_type:complete
MKIEVPTNINDITLEQFQKFSKINNEDQDEEFLLHKTIEIFCGVDIALVSKFPLKDVKDIVEDVLAVLDQKAPFTDRFELGGIEYGFIPDLTAMSLGEYIDLEDGLKSTDEFHKAASVMYRPVKKSFKELYSIDGYDASIDRQSLMKGAPVGIISAAVVFFYSIVNELLVGSQSYSRKELTKAGTTLEKVNLPQNMDGSQAYTHFVEVIRQNINQLLSSTT